MAEFTITPQPLDIPQSPQDNDRKVLTNLREISVGTGSDKFSVDIQKGMFLGAEKYDDAPFKVDLKGNIIATSGTFSGALSGATGTFSGALSAATGTFSGNITGATGTFSGSIVTDAISDSTYGFNGVFVKQIKTTDFVSNPVALPIYKSDGITRITTGLLSVYANWYQTSTSRLNFLPEINTSTGTSYWSIQKDGSGNYEVRHLGGNQASELPSPGYVIYTCLFNSNESTYF